MTATQDCRVSQTWFHWQGSGPSPICQAEGGAAACAQKNWRDFIPLACRGVHRELSARRQASPQLNLVPNRDHILRPVSDLPLPWCWDLLLNACAESTF